MIRGVSGGAAATPSTDRALASEEREVDGRPTHRARAGKRPKADLMEAEGWLAERALATEPSWGQGPGEQHAPR